MTDPVETVRAALEAAGCEPKARGKGWKAKCPAHDDRDPSLDLDPGRNGDAVLVCRSQKCETKAIVAALGLKMTDLFVTADVLPSKPTVVAAAFDYHDSDGNLLFQAVRLEPGKQGRKKDFQQRRPDGRGGWIWNLKGVPRVLYNLPAILQADASRWIVIAEGEKNCDDLTKRGFVPTTNPMGAGKWAAVDSTPLHRRKVVVLRDNDDVGLRHRNDVCHSLYGKAAELRIVELDGLPEKGDVSDWFAQGHTAAELSTLIESAPAAVPPFEPRTGSPEPKAEIPVARAEPIIPWRPFPTELLPKPLRQFVERAAEAIGCDASYVALPMLSACASAIGNSRGIMLKYGWIEPCIVWTACVGDSGTMKTPARTPALRPLHDIQVEEFSKFEAACAEHEKQQALYEARYAEWKKTGKGDEPQEPEKPTLRRLVVSDITVEALADRLSTNPRGVLVERDELSGWIGGFNQYKAGSKADESHWLSMFNAQPLIVDRKLSGSLYVPHARVCVTGGIQPGVLDRVIGDEHRESGLLARLLPAYPPKKAKRWTEVTLSDLDEKSYRETLKKLLDLRPGSKGPVVVKLDAAAQAAWIEFYNEHAAEQAELSGDLAAAWSKLEGYAARLALLVHCIRAVWFDTADPDHVDEESILAGIGLSRWFANEARRLYAAFGEDSEARDQRELVELIRRSGGKITARDLAQTSRKFRDNAADALAALVRDGLATEHWVQTGGRPRHEFRLSVYESPRGDSANKASASVDNVDIVGAPSNLQFSNNNYSQPDSPTCPASTQECLRNESPDGTIENEAFVTTGDEIPTDYVPDNPYAAEPAERQAIVAVEREAELAARSGKQ